MDTIRSTGKITKEHIDRSFSANSPIYPNLHNHAFLTTKCKKNEKVAKEVIDFASFLTIYRGAWKLKGEREQVTVIFIIGPLITKGNNVAKEVIDYCRRNNYSYLSIY